jgi:hypothetical protein
MLVELFNNATNHTRWLIHWPYYSENNLPELLRCGSGSL